MNTHKAINMRESLLTEKDEKWMKSYFQATYTESEDDEKNCRVAPSPTHGNGVFATRDFKKGSRVTLYPAHFIVWETKKGQLTATPKGNPEEESAHYRLIANDGKCSASGSPAIHHSHSAGHLLNDGGVVGTFNEDIGTDICRYILTTLQNENCDFIQGEDKFMWVVAQRDIKAGDELFVSYGLQYWLSSIGGIPIKNQKEMWKCVLCVCGKAKTEFLMKKYHQSCGGFSLMDAREAYLSGMARV